MGNKKTACCFTGHRDIPVFLKGAIKYRLEQEIAKLCERGVRCFIAGGALGFDTLAAQAVLAMRKSFADISLVLVLPYHAQAENWSGEDSSEYERLLSCADEVVYTSPYYHDGCFLKRNREMVDRSAYCVCYLKEPFSGTAYTSNYAREKGLEVINI